jgi:hypothetical protein
MMREAWMKIGKRAGLFAIVAMCTWAVGCVEPEGARRDRYEICSPGTDQCFGETSCLNANQMPMGMNTAGSLCTKTCLVDSDCDQDPVTDGTGACVRVVAMGGDPATTEGVCYSTCTVGTMAVCQAGETCIAYADPISSAMIGICVPNGTNQPVECGMMDQACCATAPECGDGLACEGGMCVMAMSMPPVYSGGCTPVGQSCAAGTMCVMSSAPSAGAFCSTACTMGGTACPAADGGATSGCYGFSGMSQCYQECTTGTCPAGTMCQQVMPDGATMMVALCIPNGA